MGEIDIIALDGRYLVFIEVKYRKNTDTGGSLAAVTIHKQKVIAKIARQYLVSHYGSVDLPCRFDVVGFDGEKVCWVKNAFDCDS